jgi:hypothetical protein
MTSARHAKTTFRQVGRFLRGLWMPITPQQRAALFELEDEFWGLVRRRIVVTGLVALIIGAGGGWAVIELVVQRNVETPLRDLQKELVRAEMQAQGARSASETARASAEQVTSTANALKDTLQDLGQQASSVEERYKAVRAEIDAASQTERRRSQQDSVAIQQRITALEALVRRLADDNVASRNATADYQRKITELEQKVEGEKKRFADNSGYTVSIVFDPSRKNLATEVQARLAVLGFRAPLHEQPANAVKGNTLTYQPSSEAKAQEVISALKPLVKDIQEKKMAEYLPYKKESSSSKIDFKGAGVLPLMLFAWDPKGMQLQLGAQ